MIKLEDKYFMMIEPTSEKCSEPIDDDITKKAKKIKSMIVKINRFRGIHTSACGEHSDNRDHICPNGMITNSLMVHYIECHRDEVPQTEIDKLNAMKLEEKIKVAIKPSNRFRGFGRHVNRKKE